MKRLLYFLPTHFTVCIIVGIVIQFFYKAWLFTFTESSVVFGFILILLLDFKYYKEQFVFTLTSWLLFVFIGMFVVFSQDNFNRENHYSHYIKQDKLLTFQVHKILKSNLYYDKYIGSIINVGEQNTVGNILLNIQEIIKF